MPSRRRAAVTVEPQTFDDPIQDVIDGQTQETADTLAGMLQDLAGVADPNSNVKVYKAVDKTGKWAWIKDLTPPIDSNGLLEDLRNEWGGGDYYFRVYANGRAAGTKKVAIAGDPNPSKKDGGSVNNDRIIEVMLQQSQGSKSDLMAMMTMMSGQQSSAQQMMMQMGQQQSQMMMGLMTALIPAMMGGKTDPLQMVQAIMAMKSDTPPAPMSEMIATMAAMKDLIGGGDGGGSDDSFLGGAAKALLPMLGKGLEGMANRNPQSPLNTMPVNHPDPMIALRPSPPMVMPTMRSNPMPPGMPSMFDPPGEVKPSMTVNRVVALIKSDVLYFANREHDPATAAGLILDVIDHAGIPENEILELVVSFQSSPDWIADLASQGVDLGNHREWSQQLLEELVKQYAETEGEDDDTGREAGAKRTLELMRGLAHEGARSIRVRTLAVDQVRGHMQKDYRGEACTLLGFVRDHIRYVRDIRGTEVLQTPDVTLDIQAGDCDDKSILLAAMLASIGHRVQFIAVSFMPGMFSHVWVRTNINGKWLDLEPTEPISCGERIPSKGAVEHLTLDV